jgi:hypothetical protein
MIIHGVTSGGVPVEVQVTADGKIIIDGTITAVVDETTLAKEAKQDTQITAAGTGNASLASIDTKLTSQATAAKQDTGNTSLASVDGKIGANAAAADGVANISAGFLQGFLSVFNGTTWDRIRSGIKTVGGAITGYLNTIPVAHYNTTQATRTDGQSSPLEADAKGNLAVVTGADRKTWTWTHTEGNIVTLAGSNLAVDPDPNTTEPDASRCIRLTIDMLSITGTGTIIGNGFEQAGTITVQPWVWDDTNAHWFKLRIINPGAVGNWSTITTIAGAFVGMKVFMQIASNGSNWKAWAWTIG